MVIHLLSEKIIRKMVRQSMVLFPLYQENHVTESRPLDKIVSYYSNSSSSSQLHRGLQHDFSLWVEEPKVARLQFIEVKDEFKGKVEEIQLYESTHDLAWRLGAKFVRVAPMDIARIMGIEEYRQFLTKMGYAKFNEEYFDKNLEKST